MASIDSDSLIVMLDGLILALTLHSNVVMAFASAAGRVFGFVVCRAVRLLPFRVYFYQIFTVVPLDGAAVRF